MSEIRPSHRHFPASFLRPALAAAVFSLLCGALHAATPPPVALAVNVVVAKAAEVARVIVATGSIHAWQEIVVGAEVGGYRIEDVKVEVGDSVSRGQELIRISGSLLAAEVASRRAALRQAEAQYVNSGAAYRRAQTLSGSAALSKSETDRLLSEQLAAQARVEAAQADLQLAELKLRYARVLAPYDGVITARSVNVGQIAQSGAELMRILRDGRLEWRGEVPEARLREIKAGQIVRLVTADGAVSSGKVRVVGPTVSDTNRLGLIYVDMASGAVARPGMFARGTITVGTGTANLVPLSSVTTQDGFNYVFVLKGDTVEKRRIQTGDIHGSNIEAVSGIAAGERIVARGAAFLKHGDRVKVVPDQDRRT